MACVLYPCCGAEQWKIENWTGLVVQMRPLVWSMRRPDLMTKGKGGAGRKDMVGGDLWSRAALVRAVMRMGG